MKNRATPFLLRTLAILLLTVSAGTTRAERLPAGFIYVDDVIPEIVLEIRYYSEDNFTGRRVIKPSQPGADYT